MIRPATADDAPTLAALHATSFGEARWSMAQIADSLTLPTSVCLIAENAIAQGFILCQCVQDEAEILTLCVNPVARRRGVGRHLLQTLIKAASQKNMRAVFLEVAVDNHAAIALYEKQGFRIIGKRTGYYRRGAEKIDGLMLRLGL